jgi:hypothetical protein
VYRNGPIPAVLAADDAVNVKVEPSTMTGVGTTVVLPSVLDAMAQVPPEEPYPLPDEIAVLSVDVIHVEVGAVFVSRKVKVSPIDETRNSPLAKPRTALLNLLYVEVTIASFLLDDEP